MPTPMTVPNDGEFHSIGDEPVTRSTWSSMFDQWKAGTLRREWARQHPDLFDADDVLNNQPSKYFAEWYAAILIKKRLGLLSLISKYGYHGHKSHLRKQEVLRRCLSPAQHKYVITSPSVLFGDTTGWPDLFVYAPDYSRSLFCEAKGPNDRLRDRQIAVFRSLQQATGINVALFRFCWSD